MAISWGAEVKNSTGNGMRVGYEFSQSPASVGAGTSSVTVTCRVYVWTRRSVYDSNNSFSVSGSIGSWSGDANISHGNNGGTTLVRTLTRTVTPSYSGTVSTTVSVSLSGIAPISGTARVSGSHTTQRRPISAPGSPSSLGVSRSSDTRQNLSWTRASSPAGAPVQQQEIRRWDSTRPSGNYITIANVSGTASSFTDNTTVKNRQYRYAVRSKNSAGESGWAYSDYISTTPNAPTNLVAQKTGQDIRVSWALPTNVRITGVEIWLTEAGTDLPGGSAVVLSGQPTQWTHTSPDPSKTWQYRAKTINGDDANDAAPKLWSNFSSRSNVVQLLAPPSAPSALSPSATARDALEAIAFTWRHNPVDTTGQTAYELEYRVDGGSWTGTGKTTSGTSSRTYPPETFENGTSVEWRVRTWGDHANASPWSQIAVLTLSGRPAVTITNPAPDGEETPVVESFRITASWTYFDPETTAQTSVRLILRDADGDTLWSSTVNTSSTSRAVAYTLADGAEYVLSVAVRDGHGLWSEEATQNFVVEYAKPPVPDVAGFWDLDLGSVVLEIEHPPPGPGEVAAVSSQVSRSANGEDWELIAAELEPTTTMVDFTPALDTVNYYRVVSVSGIGSSVETQVIEVITQSRGWVFVNGGPDFSIMCKIRDNVSTDHSPSRVRALNRFAGRSFAVETTGDARERKIGLSGRIGGGSSTSAEWADLADLPGPLCYREPSIVQGEKSERRFVTFTDYSVSRQRVFQEVSMSFEQVEGV